LAQKLHEHDFKIIGFGRLKETTTGIYGANNAILTDYSDLHNKMAGLDCVVHFAGKAHKQKRANRNFEAYFVANVTLTRKLAEAVLNAGVKKFIFISTIAVYGLRSSNKAIKENAELRPTTPYAETKLIAEQELIDMFCNSNTQLIILRPPLIYGKLAPGNFGKILKFVNKGIPLPLAGVKNKRSCVLVDNFAAKIIKVICYKGNASGIYNISDEPDLSTIDLVKQAGKFQGKHVRLFKFFPRSQKWLLGLIGNKELADMLYADLRIDASKYNRKFNIDEKVSRKVKL